MSMLQGYNIANVVDSTIPRPFCDGTGAQNWKRTSLAVVTWLKTGLGEDIVVKMEATAKPMIYADDLMKSLKTTVQGKGFHAVLSQYREINSITLENSVSVSDFIRKYMETYVEMASRGSKVHPLDALARMVLELQHDHEPTVNILIQQLHATYGNDADFWQEITVKRYQDICNDLINNSAAMKHSNTDRED